MISLASAELAVRAAGLGPVPRREPAGVESQITMEDERLGWINRPKATRAFRVENEPPHTVTILENGARATGHPSASSLAPGQRDLIFVGCSFTHGWGLNDEDTFAWKVQASLPEWKVHNFGVNGYSTCQSYMLLERLFEREKFQRPVVIYGFLDHHEYRNVAHYLWHYILSTLTSRRNVLLPSCKLDDSGAIVFNAARPYPHFPLRHTLAVVPIMEKLYVSVKGAALAGRRQEITERLLIEIEAFAKARSGQFAVLFFDNNMRAKHYREFLEQRKIPTLDTGAANADGEGMRFFDGHPNKGMTELLARSVVSFVRSLTNRDAQQQF